MFHYNLLQKKYQKQTRRWMIVKHISNGLILINIFLFTGAAVLFVGNMGLNTLIERSQEQTEYLQEHSDLIVTDISTINQRIASLTKIQKGHVNYLDLLVDTARIIPTGIQLNNQRIDFESNTLHISGVAIDRAALHALQDNLNIDERLTISSFPYEVYTQTADITFIIDILFDPLAFNSFDE